MSTTTSARTAVPAAAGRLEGPRRSRGPGGLPDGLVIPAALLLLMSGPVRLLVHVGLLLASAMPVVASLTVWQWLLDTQYGVINRTLTGGRMVSRLTSGVVKG